MKNLKFLLALLISAAAFVGCENEEPEPMVDPNGLTRAINELVPEYILDEMKYLGMPINGGANPPNIEGTFLASPFILVNSNRPDDYVGQLFADYEVTFYEQDDKRLEVMVDYISSNGFETETGSGIGSYVVGEKNQFSVFLEINSMHNNGAEAKFIHVISGVITDKGIEDLYFANFMIDDYGDLTGVWIEEGEGRVIYDSDGFSEKLK